MKTLLNIKEEVIKLNKSTQPIDSGILELVVGLRAFNIPTQSSCAGHKERNSAFPHVQILAENEHIDFDDYSEQMMKIKKEWIRENIIIQDKLINLLTEFYQTRKAEYKYQISLHTMLDWAGVVLKCIGSDLLQYMPPEKFKKELLKYQKEMKMFGKFLVKKYQKSIPQ